MKYLFLLIIITTTLSTSAAQKVMNEDSLEALRWQHRLLIVQVNSDIELNKLKKDIVYHNTEIIARKLLILIRVKGKHYILGGSGEGTASTKLAKDISTMLKQNPNKVLLIGLDGSIKNSYTSETFKLEKAFEEIDLMPMRRWEIDG
jgi:hypothetical protein